MTTRLFTFVLLSLWACPGLLADDGKQKPAPRYGTKDGRVTAAIPAGKGWKPRRLARSVPKRGVDVWQIRFSRTVKGEFFYMQAKEYTVPADQIRSAKWLFENPYTRNYNKLFRSFKYTRSTPVKVKRFDKSVTGHEVEITAEHARIGTIHKFERILLRGRHVYLVSAEGSPAAYKRYKAAALKFFDSVKFARLEKLAKKKPPH